MILLSPYILPNLRVLIFIRIPIPISCGKSFLVLFQNINNVLSRDFIMQTENLNVLYSCILMLAHVRHKKKPHQYHTQQNSKFPPDIRRTITLTLNFTKQKSTCRYKHVPYSNDIHVILSPKHHHPLNKDRLLQDIFLPLI